MARSLAQLRRDRRIDEIFQDSPGEYFVYLTEGWRLDNQHCFGTDSVREISETLSRVQICTCEECK